MEPLNSIHSPARARATQAQMTPKEKITSMSPSLPLTPLGQAVMDSLNDGLAVFDSFGRLVYANERLKRAAGIDGDLASQRLDSLRPRLLALGGRPAPLRSNGTALGEAVFLPQGDEARTLAERERQAIVDTLQGTSGRLAETARRLGISRTTLWRRLKAYGLRPTNGRGGSSR
jgi:transcriptional regulator with PAS, ATPase and Fis domain